MGPCRRRRLGGGAQATTARVATTRRATEAPPAGVCPGQGHDRARRSRPSPGSRLTGPPAPAPAPPAPLVLSLSRGHRGGRRDGPIGHSRPRQTSTSSPRMRLRAEETASAAEQRKSACGRYVRRAGWRLPVSAVATSSPNHGLGREVVDEDLAVLVVGDGNRRGRRPVTLGVVESTVGRRRPGQRLVGVGEVEVIQPSRLDDGQAPLARGAGPCPPGRARRGRGSASTRLGPRWPRCRAPRGTSGRRRRRRRGPSPRRRPGCGPAGPAAPRPLGWCRCRGLDATRRRRRRRRPRAAAGDGAERLPGLQQRLEPGDDGRPEAGRGGPRP